MNLVRRAPVALLLGAAVATAACTGKTPTGSGGASASAVSGDTSGGFDVAAAQAYCATSGVLVTTRTATWNTNQDPQAQLPLAGQAQFCEFETGTGQNVTRISADLRTIYSTSPTIAAVAYLSKLPPLLPPQPSANPAAYNCERQLKGTPEFGNTNTPGGWVDASQTTFKVMNFGVFADGSAIDEFGIFYYANGTIRGRDLATIMRY
jgi:hypothetical protein